MPSVLYTLIPCILDIALSGLSALSVLIVLKAWTPPAPSRDAVKLINDTFGSKEGEGKKRGRAVLVHM